MRSLDENICSLYNDMNVHGSILIMGAGASFESGMPLYAQFPEMIWKVLDEFPEVKRKLGYDSAKYAKESMGTDHGEMMRFFALLEEEESAEQRFRQLFRELCSEHSGASAVHDAVARLIHEDKIRLVVSLNWDDLLECAWERLYGTDINAEFTQLIKPHGDVRNLSGRWIYPNSPGDISKDGLDAIESIVRMKPVTLVVMGYSESDRRIVELVVEPLKNSCKTYRIAPDARDSIQASASQAMEKLIALSAQKNKEWKQLTFRRKNGMERALLGYRLTEADVEASARFPQIDYAKRNLGRVNYTVIQSGTGCGKSITAFQTAYDYLKAGWEVLLYRNIEGTKLTMPAVKYKTVYIVDDAQQLPEGEVEDFIGCADDRNKVIVTRTMTGINVDAGVTITKKQANGEIRRFYEANEAQVTRILNGIRGRNEMEIGNLHMQRPLSRLLDQAEKQDGPWMFNYVLRGGWNEIKERFDNVREERHAEDTLFVVALLQILSLDGEAAEDRIGDTVNRHFGKTRWAVQEDIRYLKGCRLLAGDEKLRTLHLQLAGRIIMLSYQAMEKETVACIRQEISRRDTRLLGIVWLTNLTNAYGNSLAFHRKIYEDEVSRTLLERCFGAEDSEQKRDAGYLIELIARNNSAYTYRRLLADHNDKMREMIGSTDSYTVWSNRELCNSMYNEDHGQKIAFVESIDFAEMLQNLGGITEQALYGWADFLDRLAIGQGKRWRKTFVKRLPLDAIRRVWETLSDGMVGSVCDFLSALFVYDKEFAFDEYDRILPYIARELNRDFENAINEIDHEFKLCFWGMPFLGIRKKHKRQGEALLAVCRALSEDRIRRSIEASLPRNWENMIRFLNLMAEADREKTARIVKSLDSEQLMRITAGLWEKQPAELQLLLLMIAGFDLQKADALIAANMEEVRVMKCTLALISPERVPDRIEKGGAVELYEEWRHWGDIPLLLVRRLHKMNDGICRRVIDDNSEALFGKFQKAEPIDWEDFSDMIVELTRIYPECISGMLRKADLSKLADGWEKKVSDRIGELQDKNYGNGTAKRGCRKFMRMLNAVIPLIEDPESADRVRKLSARMKEELN